MTDMPRELNADALFYLLLRRWRWVAFVLPLALAAAGLAWSRVPNRYQSGGQLLIQDQQTVNPFLEELFEEWSAKQRLPLINSIFRSHDTAERTLRRLGRLDNRASPEQVNDAVLDFQGAFEVEMLGGELVRIKVYGGTPSEAYNTATALIQTFTEQILRPQRETVRASAEFFEGQLQRLRGDDIEGSGTERPEARLDGQMSIRKALAQAEARLASAEQQAALSERALRERSTRGPSSSSQGRKLRKSLAEARSELLELEHLYEEAHPELVAARKRVRWLQREVGRTSRSPAAPPSQPGQDSGIIRHQEALLELTEARAEVQLLGQRLLTEEMATFEQASHQVWTVEGPVMPTRSLKPPLWAVLGGASFAGLILALLAMAFFAAFDDALRGEKELADALGAPSIGRMPRGEA